MFTDFGLEVVFDGVDNVQVVVPANLKATMCGLCGNYNDISNDDWQIGEACQNQGTVVIMH